MSKVIVTKEKLDSLANTIAYKSGVPVTMTIDEMNAAVESIKFPQGTLNVTENGTHNVYDYENVKVDVPEAELMSLDVYPNAERDGIFYPDFKKTLLNAYDCGDFVSNNQITLPIQFEEKVKYGISLNLYIGTDSGEIYGQTTIAPHVFGSTVYLDIDGYESDESIYDIIDDIKVSKDGLLTVSFNTVPNYCQGAVWIGEVYDGFSDVYVGQAQLMSQTVTPSQEQQIITPTAGAIGLSEVTVEPIPDEYLIPNLTELTVTATEETQVIEPMPLVGTMKGTFRGNTHYTQFSFLNNCLNHKLTVSGTIATTNGSATYEINETIDSFNDDKIYLVNNDIYIYFDSKDGEIAIANIYADLTVDLSFYSGDYDGYSKVTVNALPPQYGTSLIVDTDDEHGGVIREITTTDVVHLQSKSIAPTDSMQVLTPDNGYDGFSEVTVGGIGGKQVNFIDYDGSIVWSYTAQEALNLSELPANPSHTGLVAQGWNWSLENIKNYVTKYPEAVVWVGQMYVTESGDTEIDIVLDDPDYLSPYLGICPKGTVTIDWGDGSATDTLTGTSATSQKYMQHVYADTGNYTIKLRAGSKLGFYNSYTHSYILNMYTSGDRRASCRYSSSIKAIRLGNDVYIGSNAFIGLNKCRTITIPNQIVIDGQNIFCNCDTLRSITIPYTGAVVYIGSQLFSGCSAIQSIAIPNGTKVIGTYAFHNCYALQNITIPDGVTNIENGAFSSCYALQNITIPDSVTSIGITMFQYCHNLRDIAIPDSIASIGSQMFQECRALQSVIIPNSVTSIGGSAFQGCYALQSVIIPNSVTSIGGSAFSSCYTLQSVTIPNGITKINNSVFSYCRLLDDIVIPDGVTNIGDSAFYDCDVLRSITIPSSVTTIGNHALDGCSTLQSVTIPSGVTSIGDSAFAYCYSITEYHFKSTTPPTLGINAFNNIVSDTIIYVPQGCLEAYQTATNWSNYASYMREEES